jgi:2-iminobutanoate/2-iminopropanoate deaminase
MTIGIVATDLAPRPNGHYSQAVVHGGLVYVSLQLPFSPENHSMPEGVGLQMEQLLSNCEAILQAAGSSLAFSLMVTVYLVDIADWSMVNEAFSRHLDGHRPARGMVPVTGLHSGAKVGVQLTASLPSLGARLARRR